MLDCRHTLHLVTGTSLVLVLFGKEPVLWRELQPDDVGLVLTVLRVRVLTDAQVHSERTVMKARVQELQLRRRGFG